MKKYISIFVLLFATTVLSAQCLTKKSSVHTPCGKKVNATNLGNDISLATAFSWAASAASTFPCSSWLRHATRRYNCYAYAFHMSHNNDQNEEWLWINDPSPYTSGSCPCFSSTGCVTGAKARYFLGGITHAASVWPSCGSFTSKWGQWPLLRHAPTCVPPSYGTTINYVRRTGFTASEVSSQVGNTEDAFELTWEMEQGQTDISGFNVMYLEDEKDPYYLNEELIPVNSFEMIQVEGDRYSYLLDNSNKLEIEKVYLEIIFNDGSIDMIPFEG